MTEFDKPVQRRTRGAYRVLYCAPEKIIVRLAPGDLLEFRAAGRRHRWTLPADTAFRVAVKLQAAAELASRRAKKKGLK
jgi:hypothetical protein